MNTYFIEFIDKNTRISTYKIKAHSILAAIEKFFTKKGYFEITAIEKS